MNNQDKEYEDEFVDKADFSGCLVIILVIAATMALYWFLTR